MLKVFHCFLRYNQYEQSSEELNKLHHSLVNKLYITILCHYIRF